MPESEVLSVEEVVRVVRVAVGLGVTKVRITGGEPTLHPRLVEVISGVAGLRRVDGGRIDVAMTTNGWRLREGDLAAWRAAGLSRLTVSMDSLSPARFAKMTRSATGPEEVVAGIGRALRAGFESVKVNAVVVRGENEDEPAELAGLARAMGFEVRFIEFMPLDAARAWEPARLVPAEEIVAKVAARYPLVGPERDDPSSTALLYRFADEGAAGVKAGARVGVIAPVTRAFCGACSRLRLTADGKVRPCLFSLREFDLRPVLRGAAGGSGVGDDAAVERFLIDATWQKQAGHDISAAGFEQPARPMSAIGG
jgi:cyclic pyranopterin phosphate synthase